MTIMFVADGTWKFPLHVMESNSKQFKYYPLSFTFQNIILASLQPLAVQVNFLTKLVALKPGKTVLEMIRNVMQGKDEGADNYDSNEEDGAGQRVLRGIAGSVSWMA